MLKFNPDWRFDSPSPIPEEVRHQCETFIGRCSVGESRQDLFEHFKHYFAIAAGTTSSRSSSTSWAETDLHSYMAQASSNAPLFIEAFYDACQALSPDFRPSLEQINRVLQKSGWVVQPPNLISFTPAREPIRIHEDSTAALDTRTQELIQNSLSEAERLLAEGKNGDKAANRRAVQELLWLLETVSTAFKGLDAGGRTVEGKYFNKIIGDLRKQRSGRRIERVLDWMMNLHGYLSSPTGGGVRHGIDINSSTEDLDPHEARLFCNLIRSYIRFLLEEHGRLGN